MLQLKFFSYDVWIYYVHVLYLVLVHVVQWLLVLPGVYEKHAGKNTLRFL